MVVRQYIKGEVGVSFRWVLTDARRVVGVAWGGDNQRGRRCRVKQFCRVEGEGRRSLAGGGGKGWLGVQVLSRGKGKSLRGWQE